LCQDVGRKFWTSGDWYDYSPDKPVDLVIANDLFPNVDQRLRLFLERFVPVCREIRVSLTFYNNARYYLTRRLNADEILCVLAYDGEQTAAVLKRYLDRIEVPDLDCLVAERPSIYPNGRQIAIVNLRGDLH